MSIAVSALVRPSRASRLVLGGAGLGQLGGAAALASGPQHWLAAGSGAAALLLAGTLLLGLAARHPKTHRIDISGTGELRVTVQQMMHVPACGAAPAAELLPGSVVWPMLMLLRWRVPRPGARPRTRALAVWRDSVDADTWRALAVALTTLGRRPDVHEADQR
jgi:toxin CptA